MNIILGSKSPRRSQLLQELGLKFTIVVPDTDESFPPEMNVYEVPGFIAKNKALAIQHVATADDVILTSDTVVTLDGVIYGKPKNRDEAFEMIQKLSNRTHEVVTGICIAKGTQIITDHAVTKVTFRALTDEEIYFYIDNYQPYDKAGSYGIQEWIGAAAITAIEGSYNNVVGLPTHLVVQHLKQF